MHEEGFKERESRVQAGLKIRVLGYMKNVCMMKGSRREKAELTCKGFRD